MEKINGGVTVAKGYKAGAVAAGIKYSGRDDMALVISEVPAVVAGTFTTNVVKAAPVKWSKKIVDEKQCVRAMVLNSGIANAATGPKGDEANEAMAQAVADTFGFDKYEVLTCSTGVIGMQLPVDRVQNGVKLFTDALDDTVEAGTKAAKAIMTTDTVKKEFAASFTIDGKEVKLGGMSKGSGMIHPNMATMLSLVTTDVAITKEMLQKVVSKLVAKTFNMISVDRDTSTNDTFCVMANGLAGNKVIDCENDDYKAFEEALEYVMTSLAKLMASDGEGATRLFETKVMNAATYEDAAVLAKSVISSNLVKTAIFGADANGGRILCALGYSGVDFDPEKVDLTIVSPAGSIDLFKQGAMLEFDEDVAKKVLLENEIIALVDMHAGSSEAVAWGCDLSYDYVKINGDYRS